MLKKVLARGFIFKLHWPLLVARNLEKKKTWESLIINWVVLGLQLKTLINLSNFL